jgi:hypothetical protein
LCFGIAGATCLQTLAASGERWYMDSLMDALVNGMGDILNLCYCYFVWTLDERQRRVQANFGCIWDG